MLVTSVKKFQALYQFYNTRKIISAIEMYKRKANVNRPVDNALDSNALVLLDFIGM